MACNPEVLKNVPLFSLLDDDERAVLDRRVALGTRGLKSRDFLSAHIPLRIDGLDHVVADQAGDQHGAEDVHRAVVELVTRHAGLELERSEEHTSELQSLV